MTTTPTQSPAPAQQVFNAPEDREVLLSLFDDLARATMQGEWGDDAIEAARSIVRELTGAAVPAPAVGADDAARLDWLAANPAASITEEAGIWSVGACEFESLRAAIDAAMAASQPPVHHMGEKP